MTGWWTVAFVVQWGLLVALAVVVLALARQVGTLHLRLGPRGALEIDDEGPRLGAAPMPAPARDAAGRTVMLGGPGPARVVLFSSPTCGVCREVAPALGPAAASVRYASVVLHDPDAERTWNVPGTPFVVILDPSGVVLAKGTVNNLEQIEGLIDTARTRAQVAA
jgi:methylamine dehydrogenase accessory protein MauD